MRGCDHRCVLADERRDALLLEGVSEAGLLTEIGASGERARLLFWRLLRPTSSVFALSGFHGGTSGKKAGF